jgi:hypothetical protein
MFFRREKPKVLSFEDHLRNLEGAGFRVERAGSTVRVIRGYCAAEIQPGAEGSAPVMGKSGVLIGDEIGVLVSRGYQMTLETASGKKMAAQAVQLRTLHSFQEDLREALDLKSLYNLSLGTVSTRHQYDRVEHREEGKTELPWEAKKQQVSA